MSFPGRGKLLKEMMTDEQLRDEWLKKFQILAYSKFTAGIKEHNPDGTKGMARMTPEQIAKEMMNEAIDQFFYACALLEALKK